MRPLEPDKLVSLGDIEWKLYLELDASAVDSGSRITYFNGSLDIMTLSNDHERIKGGIAHLIAAHCMDEDIDFLTEGSTTRRIFESHGKEPDDSFIFGTEPKPMPDMVVEVALTSGGIDKLQFYTAFKIPEVWIWQGGELNVFSFDGKGYKKAKKSKLLPKFDLVLAGELATWPITSRAVKEYRQRTVR